MYDRKDKWTVGEWMTPNPETIPPNMPVRTAFFKMRSEGIRHLPVVKNGKLEGIVTDRDLRRPDLTDEPEGWHDFYQLHEDYEVRHIMTTHLETACSGDPLEKVLKTLLEHKFGALPVVDKNGDLIGILTSYDLMRALSVALHQAGDLLRGDAAAEAG